MKTIQNVQWWKKGDGKPHLKLFDIVSRIRRRTRTRRQKDLWHACLYDDGSELFGAGVGLGMGARTAVTFRPSTLAFNVVRPVVDTLTSQTVQNRPLPFPLTTDGDYSQQRRAKKLGQFFEGALNESKYYDMRNVRMRDAGIFGTGIAHNYRDGKTIVHERVFPWEICVDPRAAQHGDPRDLYLRRWVDRLSLMERFPEAASAIEMAEDKAEDAFDLGYEETSDLVLVEEGWHRPNREGDKGYHILAVSNATLLLEDYKRSYFPFSALRLSPALAGWFGSGLAEQITGLQYTINDHASSWQEAFRLMGGYLLVEDGAEVFTEHIGNDRGTILRYRGAMPKWESPPAANPDLWQSIVALIEQAFRLAGVPQDYAQGMKPAGLNSGKAQLVYNDTRRDRWAALDKECERDAIDTAWQQFDLAEDIFEEFGEDYELKSPAKMHGQRLLSQINYAKVRMDRDAFTLIVYPTSALRRDPAGRMEDVQNLITMGFLSPDEGAMLLDFPDIDRIQNLSQAARRTVERIMEKFKDADEENIAEAYITPEPEMNLDLCIALGVQHYLEAKLDGAPPANLKLIQDFILQSKALRDGKNDNGQPAGQEGGPAGAPPTPGGGEAALPPEQGMEAPAPGQMPMAPAAPAGPPIAA